MFAGNSGLISTGLRVALLGSLSALIACTEVTQEAKKAGWHTRKTLYDSTEKIQEYLRYQPPATAEQAPQTGFCYKASSDIICYDRPQPHISNKLVGYQGYTAPALPSQTYYAPENATITGGPGVTLQSRHMRVPQETVATIQIEPVEVIGEEAVQKQLDAGSPENLMPRF